jgi:hypothetical protein
MLYSEFQTGVRSALEEPNENVWKDTRLLSLTNEGALDLSRRVSGLPATPYTANTAADMASYDLPDHTLAIPWSMPGLFLLSTLGCAAAFVVLPTARRALVVAWVAVLPMSVALFAAIATAQRYTGDWIPFLVCAAALGLAALETAPPRLRLALRTLLFACTLAAVLLTFALTLHYQRETVWGVAEEVRQSYQNFRTRLTP